MAVDGTKTALRVDPDGRHWHRWSTAGVDEGRGTAGGVGERVDSGPVEERMDEEQCPEGTGDGPEQRAGATGHLYVAAPRAGRRGASKAQNLRSLDVCYTCI